MALYPLTVLGLAPILILQGRHVRRVTPQLPEAEGPRSGRLGAGPPLRLLILGDSAAAGVGAARQHEALAGQLVQRLAPHADVQWTLRATTGHTTLDTLQSLQATAPEPIDVAVTSLGVNDVTGRTSLRDWVDRQHALIELLRGPWGARQVLVSAVPPMHAFPALPQPLRAVMGWRARQLNQRLASVVASHAGVDMLGVPWPLSPVYMARDGFHPSPAAYALWAQAVADAILEAPYSVHTAPAIVGQTGSAHEPDR